ncbi:MAG: primosomal protein N' [Cyanobacteria bacterium MAG IRC1_bin_28]|nr:primosomal protein N' [Cyanobacteria bacterium MAG IRC1_bin_28]
MLDNSLGLCNSFLASDSPSLLDVLVEIGQGTLLLTYANNPTESAEPGDLVWVPVRQRLHAGLVMAERPEPPAGMPREQLQTVKNLILKGAFSRVWHQMIGWCAEQTHTSLLQVLRTALLPGVLGQRAGNHNPRKGRRQLWVQRQPHPSARQSARLDVTERQQHLLQCLDRHGPRGCWLKDLLQDSGCSRGPVDNLARAGLLALESRHDQAPARPQPQPPNSDTPPEPPRQLTPGQARVLASLTAPTGLGGEVLLWGITGSGKTEIYLQAAAFWLAQGRDVLMLCPEIGLIPQLLDRCRRRFPDRVLSYSSHLSDGERRQTWDRCRHGGPWLVVGTRSAVFLPLALLGLAVLDEEHDPSYKQEAPMPCYHARDVARYRARQAGAYLLLGSATPSLESWRRCQAGACQLLRLKERVAGGQLPAIRVVDMRQELASGQRTAISRPLRDRLEAVCGRGEQAVLFVPRRGYSPFLNCRSCGEAVMCPHCALALTVHRYHNSGARHDVLRCHWCNHRQPLQDRCHHCGSRAFKPFGIGTQRVVELLQQQLPGLRLLRYDHDTTRGKDGHRRILEQFARHQADVLVGTQMLAKGMDLPNVTMAVVLAADGLMYRPDLRAQEQALQVFFQLAGRAGRGTKPGEVLVQTYAPEHVVVRSLVEGSYDRFLNQEMESRRRHGLAPYVRACLLRLSGPSARTTANGAALLASHLSPGLGCQGWTVVGPAPAPVARVAQRSRWQLLLHGPEGPLPLPSGQNLRAVLPRGVDLTIDPDPMHL